MISQNLRAAAFSQQTDEVVTMLLTITNSSLSDPIRICTDPKELLPEAGVRGVVSRGEEFIFLPFDVKLPVQDETGVVEAMLVVDNIDRRIVSAVRSASLEKTQVKMELVLSSDPDVVEISYDDLFLESVGYNAFTLEGTIRVESLEYEPFPSGRFVPSKWPGMF